MSRVIITAPPPTPNGDLHVGHLSGPYFGADVYRRYLELKGYAVTTALSVDLNQSYVVTTAQRLGQNPMQLAQRSHTDVSETLDMADIQFDVVGMPDQAYRDDVTDWFSKLFDAGFLVRQTRTCPFDVTQNRFMFESYASGYCQVCLSGTNGNICESCGHPNDAAQLLGLHPTNGKVDDPVEMREISEYAFDLEAMRDELFSYLEANIAEKRPALRRLLLEMFDKPLPMFPVTFPSDWGVPAPFPDADGMVLNVWAEMVPGHYHWIEKAAAQQGQTAPWNAEYVQYLGFDNSFFYVIAHLALAIAGQKAGLSALLPTAFITNEFYQLDNFKFSTSQGHLIWGRDFLSQVPVDDARFYLAWSNPEYNQANFTRDDMETVLNKKLRTPLNQVLGILGGISPDQYLDVSLPNPWADALLNRFDAAYRIDRQSLRIGALTVANGLALFIKLSDTDASPATLIGLARAIAVGMAPLSPGHAQKIWLSSGANGLIDWPTNTTDISAAV